MAKILEFHFNWNWISASYENSVFISCRTDKFELLAVQGTLKSLLQHQNSKASILPHSVLFMIQLSYLYMTIGKTIILIIQIFVGKVISLLFNKLCSFVIALLQKTEQSQSTVILEPEKIKLVTASTFPPSIFHEKPWERMPWSQSFECKVLSQCFCSVLSLSSRGSLVPLRFLPLGWYHLHIWGCWYFSQQSRPQLVICPAWYFTWCTPHRS